MAIEEYKRKSLASDDEIMLASWVAQKFNNSRSARSAKDKIDDDCIKAYNGENLAEAKPDYASNHVSNFIFSTLETIRPIMIDNNPRFLALPRTSVGKQVSNTIQLALDYEWDRERVTTKLAKSILTALQTGTAVIYLPWDGKEKNVKFINVNPKAFYPDPMATCIDDAEYVIYATYKNINTVRSLFPNKAYVLSGSDVKIPEIAQTLPSSPVNNQVLVLEMWCRDYTYIDVEEYDEEGKPIVTKKRRYPKGRVITVAPEFGCVLSDKNNPYNDGRFPFILLKDYDVPFSFWGKGDIEQLLSPQKALNELNNAIIDNAKHTANMIWVVDKNSGIPYNGLKNRPGLVIRKNPGTEVSRPQAPSMPSYVQNKVEELKFDMNVIAGVNEVTMGMSSGGVTAATAIMALQEAGQARIRLKVKLMEQVLSELATMWYGRMQQFWDDNREIRISDVNGKTSFKQITSTELNEDFDIILSAGSTMPMNKNAMLDMMIRLAQTIGEDGLPMVDREALMEYVPISDKVEMLERFKQTKEIGQQNIQESIKQMGEQMQQQIDGLGKIVNDLAKEVSNMNKDAESQKRIQNEKNIFAKGLNKGMSGDMLTDEEMYGIMQGNKRIPDEILKEIQSLSDEEFAELNQLIPNLDELLASNS